MRRGIAADAPLSDAGEERLSEEDRRALKMIEELFPGEYRAAKREVAAASRLTRRRSLGGRRGDPVATGESRRRGAGREDRRGAAHRQGDADGCGEHAVLQRRQGGRRMVTVRRETQHAIFAESARMVSLSLRKGTR